MKTPEQVKSERAEAVMETKSFTGTEIDQRCIPDGVPKRSTPLHQPKE
jgi:hypothetical protein